MGRVPLLLGGVAVALVGVVVATRSGQEPPGGPFVVVSAPASPGAPSPDGSALAVATATAGAARPAQGYPFDGIFGELNRDTARAASGQYSILQELSHAFRGWIEHLLGSLPGHH
jgi:hypothetical protein